MAGASYTARSAIDAHTHFSPDSAKAVVDIMEANGLAGVVNLGILEAMGIPFAEGRRAFHRIVGDSIACFPTPDFSDTLPGFGPRLAE